MTVPSTWATAGCSSTIPIRQLRPSRFLLSSSSSVENDIFCKDKKSLCSHCSCKVVLSVSNKKSKVCCVSGNDGSSSSDACWDESSNSLSAWDWNTWARHFSEIEQAESFASLLKFQLEDAIEREDFQEAAKLKSAIIEATLKDSIAEIMAELKKAVDDERYHEASRLCRSTGSGLVGWWVGYSKDSDDPFGRIVHITPGVGRFIGRSYSPRQLINASPGTPLFEIFVVKDANQSYIMQVVFLHRVKASAPNLNLSFDSKSTKSQLAVEIDNTSAGGVGDSAPEDGKTEEKGLDFEEAAEEGIRSVVNFLKDKIPELKVSLKFNVQEDVTEDGEVKQLMEEDHENAIPPESSDEGASSNMDDMQADEVVTAENSDSDEDEKDLDPKLFIGGVLHNKNNSSKDEYIRVPAEIKEMEKDSFVLHIPKSYKETDIEEPNTTNSSFDHTAAKDVAKLMPPDVAKAFLSPHNVSSKITRDVREIIKLAVSQAQKRNRLPEVNNFSRITTRGDLDPFDGLYVGAFGPYGAEIVQLRRKYGNWNASTDADTLNMEFFEYVEAVKLTGDLNVPAGQVTFRAKIGKANRISNRGMYPDELGVVANYKGQGRIAEFGFRNPKWVEGELLQLNGKGMGPYIKGADLGFLYVVPDQNFLVLFSRLKLPD